MLHAPTREIGVLLVVSAWCKDQAKRTCLYLNSRKAKISHQTTFVPPQNSERTNFNPYNGVSVDYFGLEIVESEESINNEMGYYPKKYMTFTFN